jgi:hypothetical protein
MAGTTIVASFVRRDDMTHEAFVERHEQRHVLPIRKLLPPFGTHIADAVARNEECCIERTQSVTFPAGTQD